ncbi:two-component system response regulator CbrB [Kistimonas scapharcae]|uniref:Two-component system response regulator CbrB n=1 Tax=Kistimonas scapharcae TaxID=1036133 RepID=A0ABP8UZC6_9GAMM
MHQDHILVVEDEAVIRSSLRRLLTRNGYTVTEAESVSDARQHDLNSFALIISDLRLPGEPGTEMIRLASKTPVLIMTSYASLRSAVDSMKMGAVDYIAKPFDHDEMVQSVTTIISRSREKTEDTASQPAPTTTTGNIDTGIIGESEAMQDLFRRISKVSPTNATVLIQGESGTGKELVARALHENSQRRDAPMISVNCAAIPETLIESELFGHEKGAFTGATAARNGLVEAADRGTLFLDEIGELPLEAQARLLRVLQEGEIRRVGSVQSQKVDVRLIAATHRNLKQLSREGLFREDLYYRLNVVELHLPPLRDRGQDVILIAEALLTRTCERMGIEKKLFTPENLATISSYPWPGNVRELENAMERAVILCDDEMITPDLLGIDTNTRLPSNRPAGDSDDDNPDELSLEDYFQRFVLEHQEQMTETELAQKLGISRKCLWERRQRLGIPRKKSAG